MGPELRARGASLRLQSLVKRYGDSAAVAGVSLDVHPGEFITLLGPSGSGKTTTLNMIAGFVDVTEGQILIDDRPVAKVPAHKRDIGVVFQHYALFPHMTAAENIAFPLKQRKLPKAEVRTLVDRALAQVHLTELGNRYPKELSGGQQQRVAVARAIVFSPPVLLMDEPLGALDRQLREDMQLEIARIHREVGSTFIYVTHDQEEALVLSDRIALFNGGLIEQIGTSEELYERPSSLFAAQFLGQSNCFRGTAYHAGGAAELRWRDTTLKIAQENAGGIKGPAVMIVRPERMRVCVGETPAAMNFAEAAVDQIIYLGSARKVVVRFSDTHTGLVTEPANEITPVSVGDRVYVCWRPEDCVLVPAPDDDRMEATPALASATAEA
jgi:putative spermidine/putrescine transport system ATP-binding protein